jgi:ribosomal protein L6P/L9E
MFAKKFAEQIEEDGRDIRIVRDGAMVKMAEIATFGIESDLRRAWTQDKIEKMRSMHMLAQTSTKVYARLLKATVRQMLMAMTAGMDYEVDIDGYLHYREGLDLDKVDLLLGATVDSSIRAHGSAGQSGRFIKIRWDDKRYALVIEGNSRSVGSRSMEERIEGLDWMFEFISRKGKGTTFVIRPRPGDIYHEDPQGPGGEGGGRHISGISSDDVSQYTRPQTMANISMMGALVVRGLVPAVPVWTAGAGIAGWAPGITPPAFIGLI